MYGLEAGVEVGSLVQPHGLDGGEVLLSPEYDPDAGGGVGALAQPHGRDGGGPGQLVGSRLFQRCDYVSPVQIACTGATVGILVVGIMASSASPFIRW